MLSLLLAPLLVGAPADGTDRDDAVDLLAPYLGLTPLDAEDLVDDATDQARTQSTRPHAHHSAGDAPLWSALLPELHLTLQVNQLESTSYAPRFRALSGVVFFVSADFGTAEAPPPLHSPPGMRLVSTPQEPESATGPIDPATPTVAEVQAAAEQAALVRLDDLSAWRSRARAAAWLPSIEADYRRNVGEIDTLGVSSNLGIDSHNLEDVSRYGVRASWQLSQLVFSSEEVSAAQAALDVQKRRQDLIAHVTELYFERLRTLVKLRQAANRDSEALLLSAAELTAKIDALTNGFLSQRLKEAAP